MLIRITQVFPTEDGLRVSFDAGRGSATGEWIGAPPIVGDQKYVEFEFGEELVRDVNVFQIESVESLIEGDGRPWSLNAAIERIEADGIVVVRFGDDVILVDIGGEPFTAGTPIQIRTRNLILYDANI